MMIHTATPADEIPFGSFGTFDSFDVTSEWTDEDWAEHDRHVAEEMAKFDAETEDDYWPCPEDFHAPF